MNRRSFVLGTLVAGFMPVLGAAQTPFASPTQDGATVVDMRARDLVGLLQTISPVELVAALQRTPPDSQVFGGAQAAPWVDFGDTDLHSSLGGAVILQGNGDINDAEAQMLGGYIVYESAEIAYHEFIRKLGSAYDIPSTTTSVAGTTVWELGNDSLRVSVARIGYVMILANLSGPTGQNTMEPLIDHLIFVAARLDA